LAHRQGGLIAPTIPEGALLVGFLLLMLAAATRLLTLTKGRSAEYEGEPAAVPRSLFTIGLAGLGLGVLTGIFGIGGGFLVVPALGRAVPPSSGHRGVD
jgi:uncharacterized protein